MLFLYSYYTIRKHTHIKNEFIEEQSKIEADKSVASFSEVVKLYLDYCEMHNAKSTYNKKALVIKNHIMPFFKNKKISEITMHDLDSFQLKLLRRKYTYKVKNEDYVKGVDSEEDEYILFENFYDNASIQKYQYSLKSIFDFATKRGYMERNLFDLTEIVQRDVPLKEGHVNIIEREDFERLYDSIEDITEKTFILTLYWLGCRPGEAFGLLVGDYNANTGRITIRKGFDNVTRTFSAGKTKKKRIVYAPKALQEALNDYLKIVEGAYKGKPIPKDAFLFSPVERLKKTTVATHLKEYCENIELDSVSFMTFRHSHVSYLYQQGFRDIEIAERTGHSIATLNRYYKHLFDKEKDAINNKLDNLSVAEEFDKKT